MMPTNSSIFARSFHQPHQNKILLREIVWCSVPCLFFTQLLLPTATLRLWHLGVSCQGKNRSAGLFAVFVSMQPHTAPSFQFHNSFCSVFCSLMHLVLAVKCGLFSMFSIKSYIWEWFIKITDRWPVEIGLQGPIILWKMSARVGFASRRLSIIDSLIQVLCSDCKQWAVSQFYTVATNSSLGHHAHLGSFMPASSSFALTVFVSFISCKEGDISYQKHFSCKVLL